MVAGRKRVPRPAAGTIAVNGVSTSGRDIVHTITRSVLIARLFVGAVPRERFGPDRVRTAENLRDAIDVATSLVDDAAADPDVAGDAFSRTGIVITGSVVTAGAARTLFGRDPQ